jgi:hypothetical protein
MTDQMTDMIINKSDFKDTRWSERGSAHDCSLNDGDILVRLDKFALTANNITYMVFGEAMQYWEFFPVPEAGHGRVPVFGYATVVRSHCESVPVGSRYFGYFPLSSHLKMHPGQIREQYFFDHSSHRKNLFSAYNKYTYCEPELTDASGEATQAVLKPLFVTSYLAEDYFSENNFFGAEQIIVISASSKTAIAFAACCQRNESSSATVVGLTSTANIDFVSGLGCYQKVFSYEQLNKIDTAQPTLIVDFAGNGPLVKSLHEALGNNIVHSCTIGKSHWDAEYQPTNFPGPRPKAFFAPAQINHRIEQWGVETFDTRLENDWNAFSQQARNWFQLKETSGAAAIDAIYASVLAGNSDPASANVLAF